MCAFTNDAGKKMNPFHVISSKEYPECTRALQEILTRCTLRDYYYLFDYVDLLSDTQRQFYKEIVKLRLQFLQGVLDGSTK